MPPNMFDVQLLRERDTGAWDSLYTSSCRRTYRVLHHVTGASRLVLEELNQEVWLSAIESIEQFDAARGTAEDWVLGIARFTGLTYLRRQYKCRLAFVGSELETPDRYLDSSEIDTFPEKAALLRASVESLPENWQFVLRKKYESGMSVTEIAELAGATPKAIVSTLSRARQRLRELFRDTILREHRS